MKTMTMLEAALWYASMGYAVFPCSPRSKEPFKRTNGSKEATTDVEQITTWWTSNPDANVALATGSASGLHVVDVDVPSSDVMPLLPTTWIARTRNGGWHYVYKYPEGITSLPNSSKGAKEPVHKHCDTRGQGGYVLVYPSVVDADEGTDGPGRYEWVNHVDPVELPSWIVEKIKPKPVALIPRSTFSVVATGWAKKIVEDECDIVASTPKGGRHHALARASFKLGQIASGGHTSVGNVRGALQHAISAYGLPQGDHRKALRTIEQCMAAGMRHPRSPQTELVTYKPDPFGGAEITVEFEESEQGPEVLAPLPPPKPPQSKSSDDGRWSLLNQVRALGGLCDSFPAWVIRGADHPQPALTIASLLALGSVVAGRRLVYRRGLSSLYVVSLAGSAEGKNRPQSCLGRCIDEVWQELQGPNSFSSGPAFVDTVRKATDGGTGTCLVLDEYGMQLAAMIGPRAATHRQDLKQSLTELSTKGVDKWSPALSLVKGGGKLELWAPCVTLLGSTTPESLHSVLTSTDVADGFVGRHLWFRSQDRLPMWQPPETRGDDTLPPDVRGALSAIRTRHEAWHMGLDSKQGGNDLDVLRLYAPLTVGETPEAAEKLLEHKMQCDEERRDNKRLEIPRATLGRLPEFAARVALVLATLSQPEEEIPTVTLEIVKVAIALVEESAVTFAESLAGNRRASWDDPAAQVDLVVSALRSHGGEATRTQILRACRRLTTQQITEALIRLADEGRLDQTKVPQGKAGGRPSDTYKLKE
jgi:hypothetical protein